MGDYVDSGFYAGLIFHRVIDDFMIQGGGYDETMSQKSTNAAIKNEASVGLSNTKGTIAMARTSDPDSATDQFFINTVDNTFLDYSSRSAGYAAFGEVVDGLDVVMSISEVKTGTYKSFSDVPKSPVLIESVSRTTCPASSSTTEAKASKKLRASHSSSAPKPMPK